MLPCRGFFVAATGKGRESMGSAYLYSSRAAEYLTRRQLVRALIASSIGSTIEWYDFGLYGLASSLYIGKLYFPTRDAAAATLAAFVTFAIGFLARPVGPALFGHFGDRIGRKATLIATLLVMGTATFLIGLVPPYASIGILGAV